MNSIIWKGVSSTTIQGLLISELPPITKPEMKIKETKIDGRDGSIIEELGYSSYVKTVKIGLHGNFDINQVIKYFTGEGDIVFSNELDKVYKAKICGKIDYTRLLRYRQASIPFLVQPFKYQLNEYLRETPTETASGTSIVISDKANDTPKCFKIYGKTTQGRTPNYSSPVGIVSLCTDGVVSVKFNDEVVDFDIARAFRGIQVTDKNFATHTDASGQMWCTDEIDLEKGIYIQRIRKEDITDKTTIKKHPYSNENFFVCHIEGSTKSGNSACLSTHFAQAKSGEALKTSACVYCIKDTTSCLHFSVPTTLANDVETFKAWAAANTVTVCYILATPIEKPLTDEAIAMYKALMSNEPTITITNDENAYMMVEYFKPFEVFNEGLEDSKPLMILKGSGTVEISVNGVGIFSYTFPEGENEVYIDSEKEDAYLGDVLKNRNMNGEFPILMPKTNKIEWSGDIESISILPRSRWL